MSEERDIEKQLRAFAEKRRKEAGGPFVPHPVTRKLLQAEARRVHGAAAGPAREGWFHRIFGRPLPELAWVLSALAILAVGTWVFFYNLPENKKVASMDETAGLMKTAAEPANLADRSRGDTEQLKLARAESLPVVSGAKGAGQIAAASSSLMAGEKPTRFPADKAAAGKVYGSAANGDLTTVTELPKDMTLTVAAAPATAPVASPAVSRTETFASAQQLNYNNYFFRNNGTLAADAGASQPDFSGGGARSRALSEQAKRPVASQVLNSFQFAVDGDQVRIVDEDGSVYSGNILLVAGAENLNAPAAVPPPAEREVADFKVKEEEAYNANRFGFNQALGVNQRMRIVAGGTNLTLNRKITISGEIFNNGSLVVENIVTNLGANQINPQNGFPAQTQGQNHFNNTYLFSNGRITGKAVVEDGSEVEVDATQVTK